MRRRTCWRPGARRSRALARVLYGIGAGSAIWVFIPDPLEVPGLVTIPSLILAGMLPRLFDARRVGSAAATRHQLYGVPTLGDLSRPRLQRRGSVSVTIGWLEAREAAPGAGVTRRGRSNGSDRTRQASGVHP